LKGRVIKSTGSWYAVKSEENGEIHQCRIVGKFRIKGLKVTNPVAVGDLVIVNSDGSIVEICDRDNYVVRQSPRKRHQLHLIASNVDQAVVVVTIIEPNLKQGFIDRFLLMTEPYDIPVHIVFNKADLYEEKELSIYELIKDVYTKIGYQVSLVSAEQNTGIEELRENLKDKISLVSGQSGVGKSTLVNVIQSGLGLKTTELSDYSGKGQHTTTFAEMFDLAIGGSIIDTPGIKALSFNHFEVMDVAHNFKEFFALSDRCKFGNCTHRNEPKCAIKNGIDSGIISELRYLNYLQLVEEVEDQNYWERNVEY